MFSTTLVAFFIALGTTAWVYHTMEPRVGVKSTALTIAVCVGILAFIIAMLAGAAIRRLL